MHIFALSGPIRLARIRWVAEAADGSAVRTRVLGRDTSGRWLPLVSGGDTADVLCRGIRSLELPDSVPPLTAIRVELQGQSLSQQLLLHEVWAETYSPAVPK